MPSSHMYSVESTLIRPSEQSEVYLSTPETETHRSPVPASGEPLSRRITRLQDRDLVERGMKNTSQRETETQTSHFTKKIQAVGVRALLHPGLDSRWRRNKSELRIHRVRSTMPIVRMCLFRSSSARSNQTILNSLICCGASVVVSFAGPVRRYLSEDPRTQTSGSHAFSTDRYREHVGLETDDWTERAGQGFGMLESASLREPATAADFASTSNTQIGLHQKCRVTSGKAVTSRSRKRSGI